MARIKWKDIEVEADTAIDVIILLDKLITYQKIQKVDVHALHYCLECKSFDIEMISPNEVQCNVCGCFMTVHEQSNGDMIVEIELEDDETEEK